MANRYWRGGSGTWDTTSTTNWSATSGGAGGASVPTSADSVFFDQAGTYTVTLSSTLNCLDLTVSAGTVTFSSNGSLSIYGSMTLLAGTVWGAIGVITFRATTTGKTITTNGVTLSGSVTFNGVGGAWTLGSALTVATTITVSNGTFSTSASNYALTARDIVTTGTATITLNGSTVTGTYATGYSWNAATTCTVNAGTSTITFSGYFGGGAKTYYNVVAVGTVIDASVYSPSSTNTFNNLTIKNGVSVGCNQTITGTLTLESTASITSRRSIATIPTISITITAAAVAAGTANYDFQNITFAGAAAPLTGTNLGDRGGNSGITFPAAKTVYWNLAGTQNWNATGWATTPTGTPAVGNFPLAQDTAVFTNSGSAGTVTMNPGYAVNNVDMSGRTTAMTLEFLSSSAVICGDWKTGTGVTITGTSEITFTPRTTSTITSNGVSFSGGIALSGRNTSTLRLLDNFTCARSFSLDSGTLDLNGKTLTLSDTTASYNFNLTAPYAGVTTQNITFNGGTIVLSGSGASAFSVTTTYATTTAGTGVGTIRMTSASAKTFAGNGRTFNCTLDQGGAGALTITGANTFSDITNSYGATGATSIIFPASTTTTVTNFTAVGTAGKLLSLRSSISGTRFTLSDASGAINANYLDIQDSAATGGATWNASNSTDSGNNTGWNFLKALGNFFLFFT